MKTREKLREILNTLAFIRQFALDDFRNKYAGSALGILWAFLQPIITILLYWFVFQMGFKSQPIDNFPFILWLMIGLIPWFFISEAIANATATLMEYSYLVKKVLFNINILPATKVFSVLLVNFVLIGFAFLCFMIGGYFPTVYCLQIPLFLLYMFLFTLGISYITATLYVFFKDVLQIVSIVLQIFFWLTPIVWDINVMPEAAQNVLMLNPVYYIVKGFRSAFIYREWYFPGIGLFLYYWALCLLVLSGGIKLFNKCKNHFADVL